MDPGLAELLAESGPGDELGLIVRFRDTTTPAPPGLTLITRTGTVATGRARSADVPAVRAAPGVVSVKAPLLYGAEPAGEDEPPASGTGAAPRRGYVSDSDHRPADLPWTGTGAIVGMVDWALDLAHPHFLDADGRTRVLALWDQRPGPGPASPAPYGYGRTFLREEIDRALAQEDPYGVLGYHPADADPGSGAHGTHTASIAAGGGSPSGVAPGAGIVFVHLSTWGSQGPVDIGDSVALLEALDFIAQVAGDRPLVVNCSLGQQRGPHDGRTLVEIGFDEFARALPAPRICVHSAGNYFARRAHTSSRVAPGRDALVEFTMPSPPHGTVLDLWYGGADRLAIDLLTPDGQELTLPVGSLALPNGLGFVGHRLDDPNNGRNQLRLRLSDTALAGRWALRLTGQDIADGRYHAWLERPLQGQRPLVFAHPDPYTTTGTVCHERNGLTVGALAADGTLAPFSSSGPTLDGRGKPELTAPGVSVLAARSTPRGDPPGSGGLTRMSGTSMAAPHVTGTVCLLYEAGVRDPAEIRRLLLTTAQPLDARSEQPQRSGAGRLDIAAALAAAHAAEVPLLSLSQEDEVTVTESIEETLGEPVPKGAFAFESESGPEAAYEDAAMESYEETDFCTAASQGSESVLDEREFIEEAATMSAGLLFADAESAGRLVTGETTSEAATEAAETDAEAIRIVVGDGGRGGGQQYAALYDTAVGITRAPASYTVLALPGRPIGVQPLPGDLLVRRSEGGAVHVAVVTAAGTLGRDQLNGTPAERGGLGGYVRVVDTEGGRASAPGGLARLLTGPGGLTAPMTVLLRPVLPLVEGGESLAEQDPFAMDAYRYDGTEVFVPGQSACASRVPAGMARFVNEWLLPAFGTRRHGILACRSITGGQKKSLHAEGRAVDYYLDASDPADLAVAAAIIDQLLAADAAGVPDALVRRLGVQEIIWNRRIWSTPKDRGRAMTRMYEGSNPHIDHIHIGLHRPGSRGETSFWQGSGHPASAQPHAQPEADAGIADAGTTAPRPAAALPVPGTAGSRPDGTNYVVYADEIRTGGTLAWRNNNPGNIVASAFTRRHGSIGVNRRFAVFPDESMGTEAVGALLRTSRYNASTIAQAIARYAPSFENDTPNYIAAVARWTGLDPSRVMSTLDDKELSAVVGAIRRMEGWRAGTTHTCASGASWAKALLGCP